MNDRLNAILRKFTQRGMARNASWMLGGQASSFLIQAAYFVLLARLLGAQEYGIFAGPFAMISIVTPYSSMGAAMLFMRYAPREPKLAPVYWGNSLLITVAISFLLAVFFALFGPYYTHIQSPILFVVLVVANCLLGQISFNAALAFQAFEKMQYSATLTLISNLMRLAILVAMKLTIGHATALQWSVGMMVGSGVAAVWALWLVYREIGAMGIQVALAIRRLGEGVGYSFAGSTQAIYNDLDKTLLSHYGMSLQNGPYTLAYRMVDFATAPIGAVDSVILPRFFLHGQEKMRDVIALTKKSMRTVLWMGVVIAAATILFSPLVPYIVGKDFSNIVLALRWLSILPLLRGIHRVTGSALTGIGYQNIRTGSQLAVAAVNLGLNVYWIPRHGWIGAAWSSVLSDALLAVMNGVIFLRVKDAILARHAADPASEEAVLEIQESMSSQSLKQ
jgi:O-antigen/teichoic acid export membrane protein